MENKQKKYGIIAGVSLIVMAIAAGFSFGYVHNSLVVDSPEITLQNLIANKSLYCAELLGWTVIFVTDLIVAISLYHFFQDTDKRLSKITAVIRIVYSLVLGIAIFHLFKIVPNLSVGNDVSLDLKEIETAFHFQQFERFWSLGLIVFGFHLLGLGYLSFKSKLVHWLLGSLLVFGGFAYVFIHGSRQLKFFDYNLTSTIEEVLALPMALAEILLAFWLIYFGIRKARVKNNA